MGKVVDAQFGEATDTAAERNSQCGIDVAVGRFECKTEARTGRV